MKKSPLKISDPANEWGINVADALAQRQSNPNDSEPGRVIINDAGSVDVVLSDLLHFSKELSSAERVPALTEDEEKQARHARTQLSASMMAGDLEGSVKWAYLLGLLQPNRERNIGKKQRGSGAKARARRNDWSEEIEEAKERYRKGEDRTAICKDLAARLEYDTSTVLRKMNGNAWPKIPDEKQRGGLGKRRGANAGRNIKPPTPSDDE